MKHHHAPTATHADADPDEIRGWFAGRLPDDWYEGTPDITADTEEILIVGPLSEADLPDDTPAAKAWAQAEREALDAYSTIVTSVAELVTPSVASLQVSRRLGNGRRAQGAGSAVTVTPDGFLVTSAHVVEGTDHGVAAFADGREFDVEVVGRDPLSDLA